MEWCSETLVDRIFAWQVLLVDVVKNASLCHLINKFTSQNGEKVETMDYGVEL